MARNQFRAIAFASAIAFLPGLASAAGLDGTWLTTGGKAIVEVKPCGKEVCGEIVWLKEPNDAKGRPLRDGNNEDAGKRRRPIMGLPVLIGLRAVSTHAWQGQVYDPEKGKSFDITLTRASTDRIEITGCGLMGLVCQTHVWTRQELPAEQQAAQ